jgi:hypothetical protein
MAQYRLAARGMHRFEALSKLKSDYADFPEVTVIFAEALRDAFWGNRQLALEALRDLDTMVQKKYLEEIKTLASADPKPFVRELALKILSKHTFPGKRELLEKALTDSSIIASSMAYKAYLKEGYPDVQNKISLIQKEDDLNFAGVLADYYSTRPDQESFTWFENLFKRQGNIDFYEIIQSFGKMLMQTQNPERVQKGTDLLFTMAMEGKKAEVVIGGFQVLKQFQALPGIKAKRAQIKEAHKTADFAEVLDYLE